MPWRDYEICSRFIEMCRDHFVASKARDRVRVGRFVLVQHTHSKVEICVVEMKWMVHSHCVVKSANPACYGVGTAR